LSTEFTVVSADGVMKVKPVETKASDDWRAAIALHGELDVANAGDLRAELAAHLDAGRRVIRIDAAGVGFIDSTAIGVIVEASERCRLEHGSLILTNVPHRMRRLLSIAGLDSVLLVDTASRSASA
jgi:anti-sigma B factor antagonist